MRKRSELIFSLILVAVDVAALLSAFVAAYIVRVRLDHQPVAHPISGMDFLHLAILVMPAWVLIFALAGLYNLSNLRGRLQETGKIFIAVSGGVMFMIVLDFLSKQPIFPSRAVPMYAYAFGLIFVTVAREIVRSTQRGLFRFGVGVHNVLVIGSGEIAQRLYKDLSRPTSGYHVLGVVDSATSAGRRIHGAIIYQSLERAISGIENEKSFDGFIQADSALTQEEILSAVSYATNRHLNYLFVPNQFGLYAINSRITAMAGIPMVEIRLTPLDGWGRVLKRTFDVVGAVIGLVIFSPVFLVASIAIVVRDGSPVFYRHDRLSRSGRIIRVYKFRSMYKRYGKITAVDAFEKMGRPDLVKEFEHNQKVADDPRVTPTGRWLRRTSLDEIPQFLNVLQGDMSLVGPRPILKDELVRYGEGAPTFLALKPGITGLWQISGRSDIGYEERVKLDIYYVENWSLWLDIKILLKTVVSVFSKEGAY